MGNPPFPPPPTTTTTHVVAVPYPGRGHVNPMMNLSKLLISKNPNILITFVVTEEWLTLITSSDGPKPPQNLRFASMPNVIPPERNRADDFVGFLEAVMTKMEAPFDELLRRQLDPPPSVVVYDAYLFWVVRVANRMKVPVASFWPMSASFFAVLKHYHLLEKNGHYPVNVSENGDKRVDYIPGNSSIRLADFPLHDASSRSRRLLELALNTIPWIHKAQYLLFPSIYELEQPAIDALKAEFSIPIYTIGPVIRGGARIFITGAIKYILPWLLRILKKLGVAIAYTSHPLPPPLPVIPYFNHHHDDHNHIASSHHDNNYIIQWLDNQPSGSVLYVSQGSFLSVSREQIDEIVRGLRESGARFLWVQRDGDQWKEMCGDKGLIVPWCDQLRVLMHRAVGGFWSHCGWNSTREGVFSGVPFLTFPIFMDQPLNSKYIVEDWKVGWRVRNEVKSNRLIGKEEIAGIVRKFMGLVGDHEVSGLRERARELKQICQRAIASGGSSETDMEAFLGHISQL